MTSPATTGHTYQARYDEIVAGLKENSDINGDYLSASLESIERSRKVFTDDAQRVMMTVWILFAGIASIGAFCLKENKELLAGQIICVVLLALTAGTCAIGYNKLRNAYEFYVACVIHATLIHKAKGMAACHHWMVRVEQVIALLDSGSLSMPDVKQFHKDIIIGWMNLESSMDNKSANLLQIYRRALMTCAVLSLLVAAIGNFLIITKDFLLYADMNAVGWPVFQVGIVLNAALYFFLGSFLYKNLRIIKTDPKAAQ